MFPLKKNVGNNANNWLINKLKFLDNLSPFILDSASERVGSMRSLNCKKVSVAESVTSKQWMNVRHRLHTLAVVTSGVKEGFSSLMVVA